MKLSFPSIRVILAALSALASVFLSGCFEGGKKGETSVVVSSVDPAVAARAGRVDMTVKEPRADYADYGVDELPSALLDAYLESEDEGEVLIGEETKAEEVGDTEVEVEPEAVVRTEITPSAGKYIIERGDSLWAISRKFDISIDAIKRANGMKGDTLVAGKSLTIPGAGDNVAVEESVSDEDGSAEVVATLPRGSGGSALEEATPEPVTLPSGVVAPDPPARTRKPVDATKDEKKTSLPETTVGEDGFLRFTDE